MKGKVKNKIQRSENGNGKNGLKIAHWNAGAKHWTRQRDEINAVILKTDPDILFISEANFINEYKLITSPTLVMHGYTRLILLVRENLDYKRLSHLEDQDIATIWISVQPRGSKKLVIGGVYREHTLLGKDEDSQAGTKQQQEDRWTKVLHQWTSVANHDCVLIGDTNLDTIKWLDPEQINVKMVEDTKAEIETLNFSQLVRGPTRFWPGKAPSQVDHVWTNQPSRIIKVDNISWGASDHNIVQVQVRTKTPAVVTHNKMKRCRKNFSVENYRQTLREVDWEKLYDENDLDIAKSILQENIQQALNTEAPLKCIMNRKTIKAG